MSGTRLAAAVVGLALLGLVVLRQAPPGASAPPRDAGRTPPVPPSPLVAATVPVPARDIFVYADDDDEDSEAGLVPEGPMVAPLPAPPPLATPAPPPAGPRLVGLVRRGGALLAALALDGEVVVVKEGDRAFGYTVAAIDEDGVTLRDAAGNALTLSPPPS